ncbi:MAG: very short patch repair endonuclease [gamma proteobacterium symbiont of Ctena orbiculata]|nr:MAG: very short patch repair endonuclease [gamma proteobacterium symbiont of Ctena orbiculata]
MTDVFSKEERSRIMRLVKQKNTKPELIVRTLLHRLGYRFRLHRKDLPGSPDIVLPKYQTVIFVNGCFWHRHSCKRGQTLPKSRTEFWKSKIEKNVERDRKAYASLENSGWNVLIIWECHLRNVDKLESMLKTKLHS